MQQLLDNPVWHALCGPHAHLAIGRGLACYYPRNIAPFSVIADATAEAYADLFVDLPDGTEARLFRPTEEPTPAGWETVSSRPIIQMVAAPFAFIRTPAVAGSVQLSPRISPDWPEHTAKHLFCACFPTIRLPRYMSDWAFANVPGYG